MISPELLRRYTFFGPFNDQQQKAMAMIAEEIEFEDGEVVLEEGKVANALYFVIRGCVDLYYTVESTSVNTKRQMVPVGQINPGEPFGISTLIEPHLLTSTARSFGQSKLLKFEKESLDRVFQEDSRLECIMIHQIAKAAMERLHTTRTQLAAAWA